MATTRTRKKKAATPRGTAAVPRRGRARPILLVGLMLAAAFACVALASFHPEDPAFSRASDGAVTNVAGPVGAWAADLLYQALGYGAWVVGPICIAIGWKLAGRSLGGYLRVSAAATLVIALLCALEMLFPGRAESGVFPAGGMAGATIAETIRGLVGQAGAWIVLLGVAITASSFVVDLDIEKVASATVAALEAGIPRISRFALRLALGAYAALRTAASGAMALPSRLFALSGWSRQDTPAAATPPAEGEDDGDGEDEECDWEDGDLDWDEEDEEDDPADTEFAEDMPGLEVSDPGRPVVSVPRVPDPTQAGARELVEVEWDPTDAVFDSPPPPVAVEAEEEDDIEISVEEATVHPEPEPAEPAPVAIRGPAGRRIEMRPGNLVSGGPDDGGRAVVDLDRATPFELPHLGLLDAHERDVADIDEAELQELASTLEAKLSDFGVTGQVTAIRPGPVITTFEYLPSAGIKIARIASLSDDIAMALKALRVRIVAPIPGKGVVGIEIPNRKRQTVWIRDLLASDVFRHSGAVLPMSLGRSVEGRPVVTDLGKMPHLLVGGTTGSGKSVAVNAMLLSMLYNCTPDDLRLLLIDPKMLEFELYRDIPHLLHPVVTDARLASAALKWACAEMDERYRVMSRWQTRNIASFNQKVEHELQDWTAEKALRYAPPTWPEGEPLPLPRRLPYIVIVIDELADLMMVAAKDVEESIIRLAQKARAAGIHILVATQRPSVNVITGLIKANMPSRISFQVRTKVDSRTILDQNGAENLLGRGDMLYLPPGVGALERIHGPFCSDDEVRRVCEFLRSQGEPRYEADIRAEDGEGAPIDPDAYDDLYDQAVAYVVRAGKASASMIQREFKIGYNRASRIIEIMERDGVVGPADGARPRDVLVGQQ